MFFLVCVHQPGDFLRIYNLRAFPGSSKVPGLTSSQSVEVDHLAFHLHGGTAFGRGIRVLPENSPDIQELKRYSLRRGTNKRTEARNKVVVENTLHIADCALVLTGPALAAPLDQERLGQH